MNKNILDGHWVQIEDEFALNNYKKYGSYEMTDWQSDIEHGEYEGPGKYYYVSYKTTCKRGCCQALHRELMNNSTLMEEITKELERIQDEINYKSADLLKLQKLIKEA